MLPFGLYPNRIRHMRGIQQYANSARELGQHPILEQVAFAQAQSPENYALNVD